MREKLMALKATAKNSTVTKQKSSCEIAKPSTSNHLHRHLKMHTTRERQVKDCTKAHNCEKCGKGFKHSYDLKRHMMTHLRMHTRERQVEDGTKTHNCEECGKCFKRPYDLKRHMKTHTRNSTLTGSSNKPEVCGKILENASGLPAHMIINTDNKLFQCTERNKEMKQKNDLIMHTKTHAAQRVSEREDSGDSFNHISDLTGSSNKPEVCGKFLENASGLSAHMVINTDEVLFQCTECNQKMKQKDDLIRHMKTHTDQKVSEREDSGDSLSHISDLTGSSNKPEVCGKFLENASGLSAHMVINTDEVLSQCTEGNKEIKQKNELIRHTKTHTAQKVSECEDSEGSFNHISELTGSSNKPEICGKFLEKASGLSAHMVINANKILFQCTECNQKIKQKNDLIRHMKTHTAQKVSEREDSGDSFNHISDLTVHEPSDGFSEIFFRTYSCGFCEKSYAFISSLRAHFRRKHSGETSYQCGKCKEKFDSLNELEKHIKASHAELDSCVCQACGIVFKTRVALVLHQREHLRKSYKCKECGASFTYKYLLQQHSKSHTPDPDFRCDKCDKKVASAVHLRTHMKMHDSQIHECLQCGRRFRLPWQLKYHAQSHVKDKLFMCEECGKGFACLRRLKAHVRAHVRRHTLGKPHECEECGMKFREPGNLKRHKLMHTGEKPFLCSHCGKEFRQKGNLNLHINAMHTEDKKPRRRSKSSRTGGTRRQPYVHLQHLSSFAVMHLGECYFQCDKCDDKKFKSRSLLRNHLRTHTGEKPFKCPTCGMAFSWSGNYERHLKLHTGEKPYMCKVCGKTFRQSNNLHVHTRSHTGEKPFSCSFCDRSFSDRRARLRHEAKHAPETSNSAPYIPVPSEKIESEKMERIASVEIMEMIASVEDTERVESGEIMESIESVENLESI